jgi:glycosyltransferase involved in cell wall biosynthesis
VVHLTAVYSPPTIPTLLVCRLLGRPVVWSPRGALQRWGGTTRPLIKLVWERICGALIDRRRLVLHVTSEEEAAESLLRVPGLRTVTVPNGVEIPARLAPRSWLPGGRVRLLYIGRLHPKKGIENLLQALKLMGERPVSLVVCGGGEAAYLARLRELAEQLGLAGAVEFRGQVDGAEKTRAFSEADICIVPSFTENFGMVVAEALAHGVPVVASRGTPWEALVAKGCGLWVENTPGALKQAVFDMLAADLPAMGARGRAWMLADYGWQAMAERMLEAYAGLIAKSNG